MIPAWVLIVVVPASLATGWLLSGWQQLRGAHRAMDRLLDKETDRPRLNPQKAEDRASSSLEEQP